MSTRERILDTALRLFNAAGTGAVSTNHIAEALGISPGNLYYHFRNKEAIIRALFERQFDRTDTIYTLPDDRMPTLADLLALVRATFVMDWEFRFIYRELIALLRRDDELQRRWVEVRARGFAGFRELVDLFVAAGVLRAPADQATVERLAELCWLISEFWLASVEVSGETVDPAHMERGVALMLQVLDPYFLRWPFLVPHLAEAYLAPGASEAQRAAAAMVFEAFHRYAGMGIGEHLGYLSTAVWTFLVARLMLRDARFGAWLGASGMALALGVGSGLLEPAGWAPAGAINAISYLAWAIWLVVVGVVLLVRRPSAAPSVVGLAAAR